MSYNTYNHNNMYNRNEYIPEADAFSKSCERAVEALEILLTELEELSKRASVSQSIKQDINRAIVIHNKAARIYYIIHYKYDDIEPTVTKRLEQLYGKNNESENIPFENDIYRQLENVDELYGFMMKEYVNFIESIKMYAMGYSRPDILKYMYNKIHSSKKLKSPRKTQRAKSANRSSRKRHSNHKRSTRRHSAH